MSNLLVITLSNIGDVILTTPVITSLRAAFPAARFTVVAGPRAEGLLRGSRDINRLLIYDKQAPWAEKLKLVRDLREEFYDYVVDLRNSAFPFLVRANRRSPVFRPHRAKPARERHLEILQWMKIKRAPERAFDFFSRQDEESLLEKFKRKGWHPSLEGIVAAPGAGSEAKRWPLEGFREVLGRLLERTPQSIFVAGDERERGLGESLSQANPERIGNLAGEINLRELGALVSHAQLVLANDSACMHLAYELGRPVVALFGPSDPEKYGRQSALWKIVRETPPLTLQDLSSQRVIQACESLLNEIPAAHSRP